MTTGNNYIIDFCHSPHYLKPSFLRNSFCQICWPNLSWNSSTLATSWEELTHWKRLWCWEGLGAGEGDDRRWLDGITDSMDVSLSDSGSWWWTGRPGVLRFMGSQRVGHDWGLNWTELNWSIFLKIHTSNMLHSPNNSYLLLKRL